MNHSSLYSAHSRTTGHSRCKESYGIWIADCQCSEAFQIWRGNHSIPGIQECIPGRQVLASSQCWIWIIKSVLRKIISLGTKPFRMSFFREIFDSLNDCKCCLNIFINELIWMWILIIVVTYIYWSYII